MSDIETLRRLSQDTAVDADAVSRSRARLMAHIEQGETSQQIPSAQRPRLGRMALAASTVVALTVGGVVAATIGGDDGPAAPVNSAVAEALHGAADASLRQKDPVVGPQQYLKVVTTAEVTAGLRMADTEGPDPWWISRSTDTIWRPGDPSRPWVLARSGSTFVRALNEPGQQLHDSGGIKPVRPERLRANHGDFYGTAAGVPWFYRPQTMPVEREAMKDRLVAELTRGKGGEEPSDADIFGCISDLLRQGMVPARQRAALYEVLVGLDGVVVTHQRATLGRRTGTAVGMKVGDNAIHELVFDPQTGLMIGTRETTIREDGGIPAGTINQSAVVTSVVNAPR